MFRFVNLAVSGAVYPNNENLGSYNGLRFKAIEFHV